MAVVAEKPDEIRDVESKPAFLLVDDEPRVLDCLQRQFSRYAPTLTAMTEAGAKAHLQDPAYFLLGVVVDVNLGVDSESAGLDVLAYARTLYAAVPALVLTAHASEPYINTAYRLRAEYACKPLSREDLRGFISRAMLDHRGGGEKVGTAVALIQRRCTLSPAEVELLSSMLLGQTRQQFAEWRGVKETTASSQIHSLLVKTGFHTMDALVASVLRSALGLRRDG